jgi:hypothetical protein
MTGLSDFFEMASDPKRNAGNWLSNQISSAIPYSGLRRDVTRMIDDSRKMTSSLKEKIFASMPIGADGVPYYLDAYGEKVKYDTVLNPFVITEQKDDVVINEVAQLAEKTSKIAVTRPDIKISGVKLKSNEYYDLVKYSRKDLKIDGLNFKQAVERLIRNPEYGQLIDENKVSQINKIKQIYDKIGRTQFLQDNPEILKRVYMKKYAKDIKQRAFMSGQSEDSIKQDLMNQIIQGAK